MERRRTRLRLMSDEEEEEEEEKEEEEEVRGRRISSRKRRRVKYFVYYDDFDEEEEEEEEEDEGDDEQPGPSHQNTNYQRTQENRHLTVTCGNKTGSLDVEKLERSEECIKCEGRWFSPPAFENLAGKGFCKKWKASILHENKPLQFWIEQGSLTTKGYKRRGAGTTKKKKTLSLNDISESSSEEIEIQSLEETEEEGFKDEESLPGSEEMVLETEEERVGAENGGEDVDSEVDTSKEEEDKMEDEDLPAVADNDTGDFEETEAKLIRSTPVMQKTVKVLMKRLPELRWTETVELFPSLCFQSKSDHQSDSMEQPLEERPLDGDAQNDEGREHSGSAIEEFTQSKERKEERETAIKTETENSVSASATSSPDTQPEILIKGEDSSNHTASLSPSPVLFVTVTDISFVGDVKDDWEEREETGHCEERKRREDCENANNEHPDMSTSEDHDQAFATGNISIATSQAGIKEESMEVMCGGRPTKSPSDHEAAELQEMTQEARVPQTTTRSSNMVEAPSSRPSTSCDLDTMDLDQLRREKVKMQIKVLRLQEEYYTQKIKELNK